MSRLGYSFWQRIDLQEQSGGFIVHTLKCKLQTDVAEVLKNVLYTVSDIS